MSMTRGVFPRPQPKLDKWLRESRVWMAQYTNRPEELPKWKEGDRVFADKHYE